MVWQIGFKDYVFHTLYNFFKSQYSVIEDYYFFLLLLLLFITSYNGFLYDNEQR